MDIRAILAADYTLYFIISRQEIWRFGTNELCHKIAL